LSNQLWLLKNSLFVPNSQNLGDRKCIGDPSKSIVGHPDAILFLRILRGGVFQQPQLMPLAGKSREIFEFKGVIGKVFRGKELGVAPGVRRLTNHCNEKRRGMFRALLFSYTSILSISTHLPRHVLLLYFPRQFIDLREKS
jgi:hypothetical protein